MTTMIFVAFLCSFTVARLFLHAYLNGNYLTFLFFGNALDSDRQDFNFFFFTFIKTNFITIHELLSYISDTYMYIRTSEFIKYKFI